MNSSTIIPDSNPTSEEDDIPSEILERANEARNNLLPEKSKTKYKVTYQKFMDWRLKNKINSLAEAVFIAYFSFLSENLKSSSLWATYSMLRSVVHVKHSINIHNYPGSIAFLKKNHKGYATKKSKVLSSENIQKFISEAPDNKFLVIKVAMIFGISGACRRQELCDITTDNIVNKKDMIVVNVPVTKNDKPRSFIVQGAFYTIYEKYAELRPPNMTTKRFFLTYREGKCISQVIGVNSFGNMAKIVATYLNLENLEKYTGHNFRRTSATILADTGADILTLKGHGGWTSNAVVEGYVEDSVNNKKQIGRQIMNSIINDPGPSTSTCPTTPSRLSATRSHLPTTPSHSPATIPI